MLLAGLDLDRRPAHAYYELLDKHTDDMPKIERSSGVLVT
jgi:hypothetical protein